MTFLVVCHSITHLFQSDSPSVCQTLFCDYPQGDQNWDPRVDIIHESRFRFSVSLRRLHFILFSTTINFFGFASSCDDLQCPTITSHQRSEKETRRTRQGVGSVFMGPFSGPIRRNPGCDRLSRGESRHSEFVKMCFFLIAYT